MVDTLLGRKIAMTQLWDKDGNVQPCTVIKCGPCRVVQVKKKDEKDGYSAVQLGFEEVPARQGKDGKPGDARANKPMQGHFKKHGSPIMRELHEVRVDGDKNVPAQGDILKVDAIFGKTKRVDVIGTTKGRGFQGCMKRHKFQGGRATHGSKNHREPGAIGQNQWGHHIIKGKKLPGHFGDAKRTTRNLEVVKIEADQDLIFVKGPVAGARNGLVFVRQSVRK